MIKNQTRTLRATRRINLNYADKDQNQVRQSESILQQKMRSMRKNKDITPSKNTVSIEKAPNKKKSKKVSKVKENQMKKIPLENTQIINQSSISYQISIRYGSPKKIALEETSIMENKYQICKDQKQEEEFKDQNLNFKNLLRQSEESMKQQVQIIKQISRKLTNDTQSEYNYDKRSQKIKNLSVIINFSPKFSLNSLSHIKKRQIPVVSISKKEQKINKIQRKTEQIEEKGNIQDIANQIQKLNNKNSSQIDSDNLNIESFENSRSFISSLYKNSSCSNNSINYIRYRSEKPHSYSLTSSIRPDTDPLHNRRKNWLGNSRNMFSRTGNFNNPINPPILSFYDEKQLQIIEQSICDMRNQQIPLLEVQDWVKFVCLILKLDKRTFNKIMRLMSKVIDTTNDLGEIFHFSGACVSLYAKMQCQHIFHDQQKQFPQLPANSEHKRHQIDAVCPLLSIKQLRMAQCQVSNKVNFQFELHDTLIEESGYISELWNRYLKANKEALDKKQPLHLLIGTQSVNQRRNYLYMVYMMDAIQVYKELNATQNSMTCTDEKIIDAHDSPTTSTSYSESKESSNMSLILTAICTVVSHNLSQFYSKQNDSIILISNFSRKILKLGQKRIMQLQALMKKAKELQVQSLISRVQLQQLNKLQVKARDLKSKQQITSYIHNKSMWFKNIGNVKTHQQLQWFL